MVAFGGGAFRGGGAIGGSTRGTRLLGTQFLAFTALRTTKLFCAKCFQLCVARSDCAAVRETVRGPAVSGIWIREHSLSQSSQSVFRRISLRLLRRQQMWENSQEDLSQEGLSRGDIGPNIRIFGSDDDSLCFIVCDLQFLDAGRTNSRKAIAASKWPLKRLAQRDATPRAGVKS